jgi:hypothetical protein
MMNLRHRDQHPGDTANGGRPFVTALDAEGWIAEHKGRVQLDVNSNGWFRGSRSGKRGG